ncbi:MAG: hypothetical protein LBK99_15720 [Opitutaceae bacterium]|jgi:hypothetical protein|nr:hypothetical protein [Opitutaceae bacterium]
MLRNHSPPKKNRNHDNAMRNATTRSDFPTDAKSRLVRANNHLTALEQLKSAW